MQKDLTYGLVGLAVTPSDVQPLVRPSQGTVAQTNANPNFIGAGQTGNPKAQVNIAVAISVGVAGTVAYVDDMGNTQTITLSAIGQYFLRMAQIKATGTTATGITAYFNVYD